MVKIGRVDSNTVILWCCFHTGHASYGLIEIDYIEDEDGVLNAFELKWKAQKVRFANSFLETYPNHRTAVVNRNDFEDFVGL